MQGVELQDYARQMFEARGAKAIADAAQKARALEDQDAYEEAEIWRRIEAALQAMVGPPQS